MDHLLPERFEHRRGLLLGGVRRRYPLTESGAGIEDQWRAFHSAAEVPGRVGDHVFGVMCGADDTGFEYMCAVEVLSLDDLPEGVGRMRVPPQACAVFRHPGDGSTLRRTWMRILAWLERSDFESAHRPDIEVYEPDVTPPSNAAGIEIWVGITPRGSGTPS